MYILCMRCFVVVVVVYIFLCIVRVLFSVDLFEIKNESLCGKISNNLKISIYFIDFSF